MAVPVGTRPAQAHGHKEQAQRRRFPIIIAAPSLSLPTRRDAVANYILNIGRINRAGNLLTPWTLVSAW